ncbi:hypothetical protein BDQ94DRAFT_158059 [Aspergillus welwitschiae]|uniref:Uncharacterized protein n=1 Tax=Aspergillus welwitschiae TaxID=1341132 RepID=A0A3F3Q9K6_9EURO|nr:hypothetical protein BDQ94DRAFT_158059 [Aspergillus welwitschiae]RDH35881.1 hypothetical protein BDQ94DRAFT_158059 [Aspergillus welwitschiae]
MDQTSFADIQEKAYLGAARISLDNIYFAPHASRLDNDRCEARLLNLFRDYSCDRDAYENRIPVAVSQELLRRALEDARMPMSCIREAVPPFLPLPPDTKILALRDGGPLSCLMQKILTCRLELPLECISFISEADDNSSPFFDGEIYYKIRMSDLQSDKIRLQRWMSRMGSHWKQIDYTRLHKSKDFKPFCDAIDSLLPFPALLFSFQLGNIRRFFRMKCPEELAAYVKHVYAVWARIMDGFDVNALTTSDIECLQGRSPCWSSADKAFIENAFTSGRLFTDILDEGQRAVLKSRIIATDGIIPSMRTFLENTKFLEPAAILLRALLPRRFRGTVRSEMKKCFRAGQEQTEGRFQLSYQHLWLTALRIFPYITSFKPLQDRRGREVEFNGNYWGFFATSAARCGFSSRQIDSLLQLYPHYDQLVESSQYPLSLINGDKEWKLKSRCGMPTETVFQSIAPYLTLKNIHSRLQCPAGTSHVTQFAVARDMVRSFFSDQKIGSGLSSTRLSEGPQPVQDVEMSAESVAPVASETIQLPGPGPWHSLNDTQDVDMITGPMVHDTINQPDPVSPSNDTQDVDMITEPMAHDTVQQPDPKLPLNETQGIHTITEPMDSMPLLTSEETQANEGQLALTVIPRQSVYMPDDFPTTPFPPTRSNIMQPSLADTVNSSSRNTDTEHTNLGDRQLALSLVPGRLLSVPPDQPTPFPPVIGSQTSRQQASSITQSQPAEISLWDKSVPKDEQKKTLHELEEYVTTQGYKHTLYVYGTSQLWVPASDEVPLIRHFIDSHEGWCYLVVHDNDARQIEYDQVQQELLNGRLIVCVKQDQIWQAKREVEEVEL